MARSKVKFEPLDDLGDANAEPGSRPWAIYVWRELEAKISDRQFDERMIATHRNALKQYKAWKHLGFRTWTDCKSRIGHLIQTRELMSHEERVLKGGKTGGRGRPKGEQLGYNVTKLLRGNQSTYLASRLKRDHKAIFKRLEAGEFRSVRAAAIEAGIVKVPTPEEIIVREFGKLDAKRQRAVLKTLNDR